MLLICGLWMTVPVARAGGANPPELAAMLHPGIAAFAPSVQQLRSLFSLRQRSWPDGTPVRIFVLPDAHPLHQKFCRDQLGTYPYVLRRAWDQALFAGTGVVPETVTDLDDMRRRVGATPGAIGYAPPNSPGRVSPDSGQENSHVD
ncbi:MAG: hypothetical protein ABF296_01320 [Oceanococcaceae bacterium]